MACKILRSLIHIAELAVQKGYVNLKPHQQCVTILLSLSSLALTIVAKYPTKFLPIDY